MFSRLLPLLLLCCLLVLTVKSSSLGWPQDGFDAQNTYRSNTASGPSKRPLRGVGIQTGLPYAVGAPVYQNGKLWAASDDGHVVAIDVATERVLWEASIGSSMQFAPVVNRDDWTFVQSLTSSVSAFSRDGRRVWSTPALSDEFLSFPYLTLAPGGKHLIQSAPVPAANGGYTTLLQKISAVDGRVLWSYNHSISFRTPSRKCVIDGSGSGNVYCLIIHSSDADLSDLVVLQGSDGKLIWNKTLLGPSSISLWKDTLLVIIHYDRDDMGWFESIHAKTGQEVVDQRFWPDTHVFLVGLTEGGTLITHNSHGSVEPKSRLVASNIHTGAIKWQQPVNGSFVGGAIGVDAKFYIGLRPNQARADDFVSISAWEAETGHSVWSPLEATPPLQGESSAGPIISSDGTLVIRYGQTFYEWK